MRKLEKEFTDRGMHYKEVNRFRVSKKEWRVYNREKRLGAFTLARIDVVPEAEVFGKIVPEREKFPSSEDWGTKAFDFHSEEALSRKVNELLSKPEVEECKR